ncbi:MAG: acyl-CoA/acyl-ACP dehydrogenase [Candidatus Bathyarchaeota archaeon]|nr:acyl-CoA/acyl-ACP dehydrogenase [Candidatus Bathyarchaeota archaeon]MDH5713419.1 acyl-CoA/acyl-ACP dehydrogenase [Candidatus Bathyarchaeota archaeon]
METYPWWSEKHNKLADEAKKFADENIPRGEEILWTREFPSDLLKKAAERGWFGASIPEEQGGTDMGATGCCIISEELSRVCFALAGAYITTIIGGTEQLLRFGNDEQRKRWLPRIAKGELLGAICISEPVVGSDAAGIETTAKREGDEYVINGKKKFIINTGVADIYCLYAKTSNRPQDITKHNHLSAFITEKDTPGFTVERINELSGWFGLPNGYLDFNEVRVPVKNRIGAEGEGWKILVNGLNFERNLFAAGMLGPMREATRYAVGHAQRRIQFGQPIIEFQVNQFKIADMIARLRTARLLVYHAAHLLDMGEKAVLEASTAKLFTSEAYRELVSDAVQVMGGDGWTRFYPVESFLRDAKVNEMAAGTSEVMRTVIYRLGLRTMAEELRMPHRRVHEKLKVPISTAKSPTTEISEKKILQMLAEDYRVNPDLYMSRKDIEERLAGISDEQLDKLLTSLEAKGLAFLYKGKRGNIALAKATYKGLRQAKPLEYYKWFPEWIRE